MYDKTNIVIMAKLAVYDQNMSEKDYGKNQYFRHDYIYRQNMWVRFFVLIGSLILVAFYLLHLMAVDHKDLFAMVMTGEYKSELIKIGVFILALQVLYTIIGTIVYTGAYEKSQKRLNRYFTLVDKLEKRNLEMAAKKRNVREEDDEADIDYDLKYAKKPSERLTDTRMIPSKVSMRAHRLKDEDEDEDEDLDDIPEPVNPTSKASYTKSAVPTKSMSQSNDSMLVYKKPNSTSRDKD